MTILNRILEANNAFTKSLPIEFINSDPKLSKIPLRQLAIFTCMDTRLVEFLEPALGIRREDAIVIKNAGNSVTGSFESTIRSLMVGIYELNVKEIMVIGHEDCGVSNTSAKDISEKMLARGISRDAIKMVEEEMALWLDRFNHPEENVQHVVGKIRNNPLIPRDVPVHGLLFNPHDGNLKLISSGYGSTSLSA